MKRHSKKAVGALHTWAKKYSISYDAPIYLAVSGGADSLCLMVAASLSQLSNLTVVTVNHNLQDGSLQQAETVQAQAAQLGLPCIIEDVHVDSKGSMEAAARDARYAALAKYPIVLVAHTQNDQMESVIMGVGRGSGARSLSGMREFREDGVGRPFLHLTRETMLQVCEENNLVPWNDPHNDMLKYRRVEVRKNIVPAFVETFGSGVLNNFDRTAMQLQEDADALDMWAESVMPVATTMEHLPALSDNLPVAVKKRVLRNWLAMEGDSTEAVRGVVLDTLLSLENSKRLPFGTFVIVRGKDGWSKFSV